MLKNPFVNVSATKGLSSLFDLVFPPVCKICSRRGFWLCRFCASSLRLNPFQLCHACQKPAPNGVTHPACAKRYGLDGTLVAGVFSQLRDLVHAYKYENNQALVPVFAGLLMKFLDSFSYLEYFSGFELVPVPLHKNRLRFRGFNQSTLLAKQLSTLASINLIENLLVRNRDTETQTHLNREVRQQNMKGAFAVSNGQAVKYKCFLLIDDVATTGTTLAECGKTLKQAGADLVWAIVLARG